MFGMCNPAESAGLVGGYPHHHSHHHSHPHSHSQLHHPSQTQQHYGTPELTGGGSSSPFGCSGEGTTTGTNSNSGDHIPYSSLQISSSGNNSSGRTGNNGLTPTSASEAQRVQQTPEQKYDPNSSSAASQHSHSPSAPIISDNGLTPTSASEGQRVQQTTEQKYDPNSSSTTSQHSHSPSAPIISDNGLQYANLDGSGYPTGPGSGGGVPGYHGHHAATAAALAVQQGYAQHYSDIHSENIGVGGSTAGSGSGNQGGNNGQGHFSAYLDNTQAQQYAAAAAAQYPGIYPHHMSAAAASLKSMRSSPHDFGSSYPHDFAPKPAAPAVPTYKWMQVKRNVPKPGKEY